MPTYILSAMNPPKGTFYQMEKYFANFLWGSSEGKNKYHWVSWSKLCLPKDEGGLGIRSMEYISDTLSIKRWWNQVKLNSVVSNQTTQFITDISIGNQSKPDFPIWNASNDGLFSNKSAWHSATNHRKKSFLF